MNLIELNDKITKTYQSNPTINSVYQSDPYYCFNNNEVKYMSISFDVLSSDVDENFITFNYRIYGADRLNDAQDNALFIYQNTMTQILEGLHALEQDEQVIEIKYPKHFDYARQKFSDVLAVSYCDFSVTLVNEFDKC